MKHCPRCDRDLDESAFNKANTRKHKLQSECRECRANRHQEKRTHNINRIKERQKQLVEWVRIYKESHPCVKCGESFAACLQFHHLDPTKKDLAISVAARSGWSIARIEREIAKCVVLCANCHAKEHASLVSKVAQ